MALETAKVRQLLKEVRTSSGRDSSRAAGKLLDYVRREKSSHDGEFMAVKKDGKPFKGIAKEPDKRRK